MAADDVTILAMLLLGTLPAVVDGFPWGASDESCATGAIPTGHGRLNPYPHPFAVRLYAEHSGVDVSDIGWSPGGTYDLSIATPSKAVHGTNSTANVLHARRVPPMPVASRCLRWHRTR